MKATIENLVSAEEAMKIVVAELREAYAKSEPLVEIITMPLLRDAIEIDNRLKALNRGLNQRYSGSSIIKNTFPTE